MGEDRVTGLVIREPYISEILAGRKTWELRSRKTHKRGLIALIRKGSGVVSGVARIIDVLPAQSPDQLAANVDKHGVPVDQIDSGVLGDWTTPWVLDDAMPLELPVPYEHPVGAVIWVHLSERVSRAVLDQAQGSAAGPVERRLEDSPRAAPDISDAVVDDSCLVPVARDGSWFSPELARATGRFQIGAKGSEERVSGYDQALAKLRSMDVARWRRPNEKGNWGIVSALEWRPRSELD